MIHPVIDYLNKRNTISKEGEQRWYRTDNKGDWVPSVTTVLGVVSKGIYFDKWLANHLDYDHACAARDKAAARGTLVHEIAEQLMEGKEVNVENYGNEIVKRVMCFDTWWHDVKPEEIIASEVMLSHPEIRFAGRFDFIVKIEGKNVLVDIKTGMHYKTHDIQASMYKILWDKICDDLGLGEEYKIHSLAGLYLKDGWIKGPNPQYKVLKWCPDVVDSAVTMWRYINSNAYGKILPPKSKDRFKQTFKLEINNGVQEVRDELDEIL